MPGSVRWTLTISKDTDVSFRTFLAQPGLKKGDLSKFVEDAVQWRLMKLNIAEARARNSHLTVSCRTNARQFRLDRLFLFLTHGSHVQRSRIDRLCSEA